MKYLFLVVAAYSTQLTINAQTNTNCDALTQKAKKWGQTVRQMMLNDKKDDDGYGCPSIESALATSTVNVKVYQQCPEMSHLAPHEEYIPQIEQQAKNKRCSMANFNKYMSYWDNSSSNSENIASHSQAYNPNNASTIQNSAANTTTTKKPALTSLIDDLRDKDEFVNQNYQALTNVSNSFASFSNIKNLAVSNISKLSSVTFHADQSIQSQIRDIANRCEEITESCDRARSELKEKSDAQVQQLINNGARALSGGSAEDLFKAASNAAAVAKANAEQKRIEEESRKAIEKLEQQLTNHLTEERNKLIEKHRDQLNELKGTYYFEPDLEWERYLMKAEKYHEDEIRNIERNFSTKNASWAEPKNSPPSEPYNSANRTYSSSQYVRIAQHKYSMYEQYNKNEFLTASSEFTNKALLVDKGNVDAIKYKVAHFSGNSLEGLILYDYAITQQPHDEELANQRQAQYQKFIPDFFNAIQTDNQSFVSEACKYNYQANLKNSDGDVPIMYAIKNDKAGMFETLRRIQFTDSAFVAQQSSLLRMCIIENASKTIHTLILDGASPNTIFRFAKDSTDTVGFEMTALNFSAFKTKKNAFETLLEHSADFQKSILNSDTLPNPQVRYRLSSLMLGEIAERDDTTHLSTIIARYPKLYDSTFLYNDSYLSYCVHSNKTKVLDELLKKGGNSNGNDHAGIPYMYTALTNNEIATTATLKKYGGSYNGLKFEKGYSLAHLAVKNKNFDLLKEAVSNNPSISNTLDDTKQKPLHMAIQNNDELITAFLLASTTDILTKLPDGNTPFFVAIENKNDKIASLLLDKEPKLLHEPNIASLSPIAHCVKNKTCLDMVSFLLSKGADPNTRTSEYWPILHLLIHDRNAMAISELLKYKPNLNTKGAYGWTALHYAARENNQVLIKDLLYAGADPSIKDNWGRTPIKITKERNFKEAKKLFKN